MQRPLSLLFGVVVLVASGVGACSDSDTIVPPPPVQVGGGRCVPPPRSTDATIKVTPAFGGQKLSAPIELIAGPGNRFYALEQKGLVRVLDAAGSPATTALDISAKITSGGEAGLLGIAFDPKFADDGFVYLDFTAPVAQPKKGVVFQSVIARFHSNDGGLTIDPASEKRILVVDQPFANHNGGHIAFGPDGFLYISLGDGGSGGDPMRNGQNKDVLLGKVLRIDPRGGDPYAIPPSNPFAAGGGRPEIFAYGLRNTWKFSFDTVSGELWAGDVGQNKYEEVDRIVLGGNYGWNTREGKHCFAADTCATEGFIDGLVEYDHSEGVSITGGYVYRGTKIPGLFGKFVYGDFGSGRIWAVEKTGPDSFAPMLLAQTELKISTFGQAPDGELFVADYGTGVIHAIEPAGTSVTPTGLAVSLAETGCLDPKDATKPPPGLVGYTVNSPLWSDGATKDRWLYLPEGTTIGVMPDGDFDLPPGSTAVKTFSIGGKKIETRLFVRYPDAMWAGYSYEWNDDQTDATLLEAGKTKPLPGGTTWTFPSRAECFACHTSVAGFTLGLETRQLDRDEGGVNQLDRFAPVLDKPVVANALAPLRAGGAAGASDEERARGYLHANCSICHREGYGAGAATIDLRIDTPFAATKTCNAAPQGGDLGVSGSKIVAPGDPSKSTLALRMRALDQNRMPPLATHVVDETGVSAIESWIRGLPPACP
ncbi:MAG: hypothetical protein JWP87_1761 [Labilithrix sp.]|nr:hypothetical protein [Labilithrix sp.]